MADENDLAPLDDMKKRRGQRARWFLILGLLIIIGGGGWAAWRLIVGGRYVTTDNAYAGASAAQITPQVSGAIATVPVHDSLPVKAGDVLVTIDPSDAQIALERAQAQYRLAVSRVKGYFAADVSAGAQIQARQADVARARSEVDRANTDLQRRQRLAGTGAVSAEEVSTAQNAVRTAQAALDQATANLKAAQANQDQAQALTGGQSVENNPEVAAAEAAVAAARLDLERTTILAPVTGVVANNKAQIGQRVMPGETLMMVVPIQDAFVDANFKEGQLRKVRVGQPVELTADLYGSKVIYHGTVLGIGGGTGSAFAAIPAQNATGNWIKVVQRVPVRIQLDPKELAEHPLRVGLSMSAKIDVSGAK